MARPIDATPTLRGKDAERLVKALEAVVVPADEQRRRQEQARQRREALMRPKGNLGGIGQSEG